jgi:hypothetical protein
MPPVSPHNAYTNSPATPQQPDHCPAPPDLTTLEIDAHAVYHGWPRPDGQVAVVIESPPASYRPLPHLIRHSPTGFNCGYNGNGPRDLALSLLTDTFNTLDPDWGPATHTDDEHPLPYASEWPIAPAGIPIAPPGTCRSGISPTLLPYLHFTEQIIAHLPRSKAWELSRQQILDWLVSEYTNI